MGKIWQFTSESVTEGHPDKVCDQISDAILDEILKQDPQARSACEVVSTTACVFVTGEITTTAYCDVRQVVTKTLEEIGYTRSDLGFSADNCAILSSIKEQSPDIAGGVDHALESRGQAGEQELGAGDQGMMFGFANRDTEEMMPLPIALANRLTRRLAEVRKKGLTDLLLPDGKSQVTITYEDLKPIHIDSVLISSQHIEEATREALEEVILNEVIRPVMPAGLFDEKTKILINPSGRFVIGGPKGDSGLTGRKIIVDSYGGYARHGGGAFSGKDCTKVDRTGAYAARYLAKNVVAAGLADACEVQLAYAIGVAEPLCVNVETYGTGKIDDQRMAEILRESFDLRPRAIIEAFGLRRPIYRQLAAYGHFGRTDLNLDEVRWERTDLVDTLKAKAAL